MPPPGWQQPSAAPGEMTASTGGCSLTQEHRGQRNESKHTAEQEMKLTADLLYSAQNRTPKIQLQHTECHLE